MVTNFEELMDEAKKQKKMTLAVAVAQDEEVLLAVNAAKRIGIIDAILVGDEEKIKEIADMVSISLEGYKIVDCKDLNESAKIAVSLVSEKKADFLMKGFINTADLLKAVLNKETGLRGDGLLSHVMIYDIPTYHKLIFLTDGGMVTYPDLQQKIQIIKNAIKVTSSLGINPAKVVPLSAVETVNKDMQSTIDAASLTQMAARGQIKNCIIDGPLALDNAVSKEAAQHKGVNSPVAGDVDIILVPNIETGNALGKSLTYFALARSAGVVMGAKCPIVLVSRADTHEAKLYAIALGCLVANNK